MRRKITLLLMALMVMTTAFSQTTRSKGEARIRGTVNGDWETITFDGNDYLYFLGNDQVDNTTINTHLLGHHWKGQDFTKFIGDSIYFCNVETGEYLQIGDLWGENGMTSHVGIPYKILEGTSTRQWGVLTSNDSRADMSNNTYWIQPLDVRQERVLGRSSLWDGGLGQFEHNRYLYLRSQSEYQDDPNGTTQSGVYYGGFLFKFEPHKIDETGEQAYVIYTRRQTDKNKSGLYSEYQNRESYLLLTSLATETSDFKNVRFKKFAGQMGAPIFDGIKMTFLRSGGTTASNVTVNITDMKGGAISGASASLVSVDFSTGYTALKTSGAEAITGGAVLAPDTYDNNANAEITYTFRIQGLPTSYSFNAGGIDVYSMRKDGTQQGRMDRDFQFSIAMGSSASSLTAFASTGNINLTQADATPNVTGGLYHGVQALTAGSGRTATGDFYIKVTLKKISSEGCYAGIGAVSLYNKTALPAGMVYYGSNRDNPVEDEIELYNNGDYYVDIATGLENAKKNKNNLWKIVTKKQRDRFRLVANEEKPVDVSSRIFNPKFNTSYVYNILYDPSEMEKVSGEDGYKFTDADKQETYHPEYGWTWFHADRDEYYVHDPVGHFHPWARVNSNGNPIAGDESTLAYAKGKDFHKVGTGLFWRYGNWNGSNYVGGYDNDMQEMHMTHGVDANYCGSIYHGTANLQQTIKGLREGNYIVFVRGFFAPHDMEKYTKSGDTYQFNGGAFPASAENFTDEGSSYNWKDDAFVRMEDGQPVWRRSHDSYLFAWSHPEGMTRKATQEDVDKGLADNVGDEIQLPSKEVRRMLPSIYEGATPLEKLGPMSRDTWLTTGELFYSPLNSYGGEQNMVKDAWVFGHYDGGFFDSSLANTTYVVPKTVAGAGRFFNATDAAGHPEAQNYRIGLPVYVGSDGNLTIGVDHTYITDNPVTALNSGKHEWVCFDEFELLYLGADEPEEFFVDELEAQDQVGPYYYINGYTGEPFKEADKEMDEWQPWQEYYLNKEKSEKTTRRNNTQVLDIFSKDDINNMKDDEYLDPIKTVKKLVIRRTLTKDGWNSIVLPVPLSAKQVEQGFGKGTLWSRLHPETPVLGRTLVYEAVTDTMMAGQPYIIKPGDYPAIDAGDTPYKREAFTKKVANTRAGVAGLYFKNGVEGYYRNYEIEPEMAGPIYVIEDVEIDMRVVFPNADNPENVTAATQWPTITGADKKVKVRGYAKPFTMKELGNYENPDPDKDGDAKGVPANAYYFNKGALRYTSTGFNTTKGLFAYMQLFDENNQAYSKPFIDSDLFFEEYFEDISGVKELNNNSTGKVVIYDLLGRPAQTTKPGLYIVNGKKVLFK